LDPVGRYQILEELGRGAHGVVYKALDPAIGRTIALKAIALGTINVADRASVRDGILREARLAGTLSHPNIVTVYDVLDQSDSAYIMMEFVDGQSLADAITATNDRLPGKLDRYAFVSIMKQVAQALDYAHRKGIIHRDIKPANIVLTDQRGDPEPLAKIADFGVAKFTSQDVTQQVGGQRSLMGTPSYMSPEQLTGSPLTGAADQFSLAVIAYEVLCGRKAFAAETVDAVLYQIRNEQETAVTTVNSALSPTVDKVMQRAMAKDPEKRFGTCSEFAGALEFALGDSPRWAPGVIGADPLKPSPSTPVYALDEPEEQKSWLKRLALLVVLCLAVGLAIVMIVRMNSGPAIPTQTLDTRNAPVTPPPSIQDLKYDRKPPAPPLDLTPAAAAQDNAPTVVNVPVPVSIPNKKPAPLRHVKAARSARQPVATSADVQLLTDPPGADVVLDGANSCLTPCSVNLPAGRHTLAASMNGFATFRKIFYVPADTNIFLALEKKVGVLLVSSEPPNATVNVDGNVMGKTPLTLRLSPGIHRVAVWDGSHWQQQTLQITADSMDTRIFRF
jgi:serine/threonine protein kinase